MNKNIKKGISAALCGAMIITAASCGNTTGTALTIDGTDIRAGIYIYYQSSALNEASAKLSEEQPDLDQQAEGFNLLDCTISGVSAREWAKNKTIELCREYVAIEKTFEEYGLSLTAEEKSDINKYVKSLWTEENMYAQYIYGVDIIGEYYEAMGVGEQSFKDVYTLTIKKDKIFDHLYKEGGALAVSADELTAAVRENNALVKYFEVDETIGAAQTYVDMLNSGTAFATVKQNYDTAKEVAEVTAEMAEAEENNEEYDGIKPEEVIVAASEEKDLQQVIAKDSESPSESFVKAVFEMSAGENKAVSVTEDDKTVNYVVSRIDIESDAEVMESYSSTELHKLKDDELDKTLADKGSAYSVTENAAAIKLYKFENVK